MDGNKKISILLPVAVILTAIAGCTVQIPFYGGLYIDDYVPTARVNIDSAEDVIIEEDKPFSTRQSIDTLRNRYNRTNIHNTIHYEIPNTSLVKDSTILYGQMEDTLQLLMAEWSTLRNELFAKADSSLLKSFSTMNGLIDTVWYSHTTSEEIRPVVKDERVRVIKDTGRDTVYISINTAGSNDNRTYDSEKLESNRIVEQKRQIALLQRNIEELRRLMQSDRNNKIAYREIPVVVRSAERTPDNSMARELATKDRQIQELQAQVSKYKNNTLQSSSMAMDTSGKPPARIAPDTIIRDTVREAPRMENDLLSQTSVYGSGTDSSVLRLIIKNTDSIYPNKVLLISEITQPKILTDSIVESVFPKGFMYDTLEVTAYYHLGKIIPWNRDTVFSAINNKKADGDIEKVFVAGYTDISGSKSINTTITNKRLNFITGQLESHLSIKKIFIQNFGETYASKIMNNKDRKVVVTLILRRLAE